MSFFVFLLAFSVFCLAHVSPPLFDFLFSRQLHFEEVFFGSIALHLVYGIKTFFMYRS